MACATVLLQGLQRLADRVEGPDWGRQAACCIEASAAIGKAAVPLLNGFLMPHKANSARRHHIPRPKWPVINSAEYDAALRQRLSLTVWFTEEAIAARSWFTWKRRPGDRRG